VNAFASQQNGGGAGRPSHLGTLARNHLDAVDSGTHWDVADRQSVTGADGSILARKQRSADFQTTRSNDVTAFAVEVAKQRDVSSAVGVVLEALDLGRDTVFITTKVDNTVLLLVATTTVTDSDMTVVVTARSTRFFLEQACERRTFVQIRCHHL